MTNIWISVLNELPEKDACVDVWLAAIGGDNHGDEWRLIDCYFYDHQWWCRSSLFKVDIPLLDVEVKYWIIPPKPPTQED